MKNIYAPEVMNKNVCQQFMSDIYEPTAMTGGRWLKSVLVASIV